MRRVLRLGATGRVVPVENVVGVRKDHPYMFWTTVDFEEGTDITAVVDELRWAEREHGIRFEVWSLGRIAVSVPPWVQVVY